MLRKRALTPFVFAFISLVIMADSHEGYKGLSPQQPQTYGFNILGLEINTYTGNLLAGAPLFFIPGRGLPLDCYLLYNSDRRKITSPFGKGWSFSYHIRYQRHQNGDITIVWGSGRQDRFQLSAEAGLSFTPPNGVHWSLRDVSQKVVLENKYGIAFHFDNNLHRKLTKIVDPHGNELALIYDFEARLKRLVDASDREIELFYDSQDYVRELHDVTGNRKVSFDYDAQGHLIGITDPLSQTTQYVYNSEHLLTGITDKLGVMTTISYMAPTHDPQTRLPETISKGVLTTTFSFDRDLRRVTMTDPRDEDWLFTYDAMGRMARITDPHAKEILFTWDSAYNLTGHTDRLGNSHLYTHDAQGNQLTHQDPLGNIRSWTYDPVFCRTRSHTDRNGNLWNFDYDGVGNLIQITDPIGFMTTITYDAMGQAISSTNPEMETTFYDWDMYGNMRTITTPLGNIRNHAYDALSREIWIEDANGHRTSFGYDALNRSVSRTNQAGQVAFTSYDAENNVISTTDERGATTTYSYDVLGRRVNAQDPLGNSVSYIYDAMGHITNVTDKLGNTTSFTYDALGRMITRTTPLGNTWIFGYDCEGRQTSRQDPKGQTITRTFDGRGRLVSRTLLGDITTSYIYDPNDNLLSASRPASTGDSGIAASTITRTYDALNRKISETDVDLGMTISAIYHADGMLKSTLWPDGSKQTFAYNAENRLTQTEFMSMALMSSQTIDYVYDAAGRLLQVTRPSGPTTEYGYDDLNRITSHETRDPSRTITQTFSYSDGVIEESLADTAAPVQLKGGIDIDYHLDLLNRIFRNQRTGTPLSYEFLNTFDANGNKTGSTGTTPFFSDCPWTATYNGYNQLVMETGKDFGGPYTRSNDYDENGNLIKKNGTGISDVCYDYNPLNQVNFASDSLTGSQVFGYDALDRLNCITVGTPAPGEYANQRFFYDLANRITFILDKVGNIREQRAYDLAILNDRDADDFEEILVTTDFFAGELDLNPIDTRTGRGLLEPLADYYMRFNVRFPKDPPSDPPIPTSGVVKDQDGLDDDENVYIANFFAKPRDIGKPKKPPKGHSLFNYPGHLGNAPFPAPPKFPPYGFPRYPGGNQIRIVNTTQYFQLQDAFGNTMGSLNGALSGLLRQIYDLLGRIIVSGNPEPLGAMGRDIYRPRINGTVDIYGVVRDNYTTFRRNQPHDPSDRHNRPFNHLSSQNGDPFGTSDITLSDIAAVMGIYR